MHALDWLIIALYLVAMLALAASLGRKQRSRRDYFLGGNDLPPWSLATSTIATQASTNSLLGAPAFVGFILGGGMLWLQYELAVPLAMLLLIWLLGTVRKTGHISIYTFLEDRLGPQARLLASGVFLIFRGLATGVTVYGVSIMVTLMVDVSYTQAVLLLMAVTILYDVLGGMRAVVISDVLQMGLILAAVLISLLLLTDSLGGLSELISFHAETDRMRALDWSWGLSAGENYGIWPMLFGGLFLYMAYYGCDQSQAQRVLASRSPADAERVLVLNGLLRFPLVLLYCLLGLALAAYASQHEGFIDALPLTAAGQPNYNLVFPAFVLSNFPVGLVGLILAGILAAAMSSIDSSLNALSAATIEDFLARNTGQQRSERWFFIAAKVTTLCWGLFAVGFSYQVEAIAPTVLEAINKIGSLANGPLLGLFGIALLVPAVGQRRAIAGFAAGFAANVAIWLWLPQISWLWWNVTGCVVCIMSAVLGSGVQRAAPAYAPESGSWVYLSGMAVLIFCLCLGLNALAA